MMLCELFLWPDYNPKQIIKLGGNMVTKKDAQLADKAKVNSEKVCFIVAPIGANGTDIRRATEGLMDAVLRPLLEDKHGYRVEIAHEISVGGSISDQIINYLLEASLVIVDLTGLNPNVMYELAIRHCIGLPLVVIAREGTDLPFDVVQERTIFYHNDMHGVVELIGRLDSAIDKIHELGVGADNPVTRARQSKIVKAKLLSGDGDAAEVGKFFLDQINELKALILRDSRFDGRFTKANERNSVQTRRMRQDQIRNILINSGFQVASVDSAYSEDGSETYIRLHQDLEEEQEALLSKILIDIKRSSSDKYFVSASNGRFSW